MYITPITANRNQRQISFTQRPTQWSDEIHLSDEIQRWIEQTFGNQRQIRFTQRPTQLADDIQRLVDGAKQIYDKREFLNKLKVNPDYHTLELLVNANVSDSYGTQSPRFTEYFISDAINANLGSNILKLLIEATFMDDQGLPKFLFKPVDIMYLIGGISTDCFGEPICRSQKDIEYYTQKIKNAIKIALNDKTTSRDEKVELIKKLYEELPCNWARIVKEMNIQENKH